MIHGDNQKRVGGGPVHMPQHSTSSGSSAPVNAITSAPTLGTITHPPNEPSTSQQQQLLVSPFQATQVATGTPTYGPAPRPFGSPSTPTSISTGSTPLATTPGGSSTPIKLSLSSLAAAADRRAASGGSVQGPTQSPRQIDHVGGPQQTAPKSPMAMDQQPDQLHYKQQPITNVAASSQYGGGVQAHTSKSVIGPTRSKIKAAKTTVRVRESTNETSWSYYLFLGIFLLALLTLIITLVITKSRS